MANLINMYQDSVHCRRVQTPTTFRGYHSVTIGRFLGHINDVKMVNLINV